MFPDQRLVRLTLQAAVRHAKAHGGPDARGYTIFFVKTVLVDMRKRRWFDGAATVALVLRKLEYFPTVLAAAKELGMSASDFRTNNESGNPPPSNTGVAPRTEKLDSIVEEYFNG